MSKLYEDPVGDGDVAIHDPDPLADRPPTPSEGRVAWVDFEYSNIIASDEQWCRCQVCPLTVRWAEPHIRAGLVLDGPIGRHSVRAIFCSKECWYEWATRG